MNTFKDALRYQYLKDNCIVEMPANRDGPSFKYLKFLGECHSDWKFDLDHMSLDEAIDKARTK